MADELLDPAGDPVETVHPAAPAPGPITTPGPASHNVEAKAALRNSVACFVPREMSRRVAVQASTLRAALGDQAAAAGVTAEHKPDQFIEVSVGTIWELTGES